MNEMMDEFQVVIQSNSTCKYDNSCGVCHKNFACKRSLINHYNNKHQNTKPYACHICLKRYASNGSLRGHYLTHPDIPRENCIKCSAVIYPGSFVQHSCTRLPDNDYIFRDGRFVCPKCNEAFDSTELYGVHRATHVEPNSSFICDFCKVQFHKKSVFKKHMTEHIVNSSGEYTCPQCSKNFLSSRSLMLHTRVEHEGVRYTCDICYKQFKYLKSLRDHLDKHSKVKSHQCPTCFKEFNYKSSYDNHIKLHEAQVFKCSVCGRDFSTESQLKVHQKMHGDVKEHQCQYCDKAYHLKKHLNRHMASHQDRNFICELCATEFTLKSSYTHHMSLHYQGKKFKCNDCNKSFATNYKLKKHLFTHTTSINHCPTSTITDDDVREWNS